MYFGTLSALVRDLQADDYRTFAPFRPLGTSSLDASVVTRRDDTQSANGRCNLKKLCAVSGRRGV